MVSGGHGLDFPDTKCLLPTYTCRQRGEAMSMRGQKVLWEGSYPEVYKELLCLTFLESCSFVESCSVSQQ